MSGLRRCLPLCSFFMDIYFNELSLQPYNSATLDARIIAYANLIRKCYAELRFEKVRYALDLGLITIDNNLSLHQYCINNSRNDRIILILSTKRYPYIDNDDQNGDDFIDKKFELNIGGMTMQSEGFGCACLHRSFCVGFPSVHFNAANLQYTITVTDSSNPPVIVRSQCYALSNENDVDNLAFRKWAIGSGLKIILPSPKQAGSSVGKINLGTRGHHGTAELTAFANTIINDKYVLNVVHSLPFHHSTTFYHGSTKQNGRMIINITLYKYHEGFSMAVETTAKDEFEAEWVANRLEDLYYK